MFQSKLLNKLLNTSNRKYILSLVKDNLSEVSILRKIHASLELEKAKKDFFIFAKLFSKIYDPTANMDFKTYKMSCEILQAFMENRLFIKQEDEFKRVDFLFFNACPSWGKSYLITRLLTCWWFSSRKIEQFIISANEKNRKKIMMDIDIFFQMHFFRKIFPEFNLNINNQTEKINQLYGWLNMNPARSDITGNRGDFFIFDDFDKPTHLNRAEHETSKEFLNMYLTRGYKNKITKHIVVAQRVALDDATGYIQDILHKGKIPYIRLNIPYKFETDEKYEFYIQNKETGQIELKEYFFKANTFSSCNFTEEKYNGEVLYKECQGSLIKRETQYQGRPSVNEGAFIQQADLSNRYNDNPETLASKRFFDNIYISGDTASKTGKNNDYSNFVVIGEKQGFYYILDNKRVKKTAPNLFLDVCDLYFKWKKYQDPVLLIEDKSSGEGLIQKINEEGLICRTTGVKVYPVLMPIKPKGSKEERLQSILLIFKAKRVMLPQSAEWLIEYEKELTTFPHSKHDDQVDATVNGLKYIKENFIEIKFA